ncbi:NAD(P)/FAD-dependent oxidoreductase [Paenibacillus xanthanilyticus]|uniref:NAD(P)/FAD-dependent oxidoreductase n=1 Tax=Paenibacillus xanthanilyticus TaxID=1783531 RepID=A0ABV8K7C2_9BACL
MRYDCAILGGGPAGLNAALLLGRARREVLLLDDGQPRNRVTRASHGFLTRDGVQPAEFRRLAHEELARYPSVAAARQKVIRVNRSPSGFSLQTASGSQYEAGRIILATGLAESFPDIEGFGDFYGSSLFNCPYCDGWELRDKRLVLVSESAGAFHTAKLLYNWSKDLIVCTNWQTNLSAEQQIALHRRGISVYTKPIARYEGRDGQLEAIRFKDGTSIARDGGFVTPRFAQKSDFGEQLGCELNAFGAIVTDAFGRTSARGVYAAGDSSVVSPSQLVIAAAEGSRAAMGVNADLTEDVFRDA